MTGCSNFFIPVCQAYDTCTTSTTTGTPTIASISPTSGAPAGGITVTITGTNFTSGATVAFGGASATNVTVASSTSITATSPAGTGTVGVTVTTSAGTSNSASYAYTTTTAATHVYVANQNAGTISGYSLGSGALTSLSGSPYILGAAPGPIVASPSGTLLYAAMAAGPVYVYGINSNGSLTLGNGGQQVTSTYLPTSMTIDRTGNWLFLVSSSSPQLLEYQIDTSTGVLIAPSGNPTSSITLTGGTPMQVYITPNNQFIYVALGTGGVDVFSFDATTGGLSTSPLHLNSLNPATNGDNTIGSDLSSSFLFVGETGSGVRVFTIGSNGSLKEVTGSPFQTPQSDPTAIGPAAIVTDPTNKYVYVANRTSSTITGYSLGTTGTLTQLSTSPFTAGTGPLAMSLDTSGQYLLVASYGGGPDLQVFSFDTTSPGKLDTVTSTATGADPTMPISLAVAQ